MRVYRQGNNVWATHPHFDPAQPSLLLQSHHDTVKPNAGYTRNPFDPTQEEGKLYGLGSNDAGGALICLLYTFLHFAEQALPFNLVYCAAAEEEISGRNGIESVLPLLPSISCAIVGEPTQMQMAVSEKGLLVIDAVAKGQAGHAARDEGINAILIAMQDIALLQQPLFPELSPTLGKVHLNVTSIHSPNRQHNVVPDECRFTIDIRVTDCYTHEDILQRLQQQLNSQLTPRSMRLRATCIPDTHALVLAGKALGRNTYGSPTLSDKALMPFPTLKMGPGHSSRSHTADEYIYIHELQEGLDIYIQLIEQLAQFPQL
jgi:acetylornithine deacetylase